MWSKIHFTYNLLGSTWNLLWGDARPFTVPSWSPPNLISSGSDAVFYAGSTGHQILCKHFPLLLCVIFMMYIYFPFFLLLDLIESSISLSSLATCFCSKHVVVCLVIILLEDWSTNKAVNSEAVKDQWKVLSKIFWNQSLIFVFFSKRNVCKNVISLPKDLENYINSLGNLYTHIKFIFKTMKSCVPIIIAIWWLQ